MDTGLGAKAYSIIEQGKIGMILSSRPTDRRQLIEEAAGITKYKARRRAAELKLEAAQQNLTRIDDIVFEVEKQRGTLKRQAAKARRYTRLRDEMRRWEKVLFARRYRSSARRSSRPAPGWPRPARARRRRRRGSRKSRPSSRACGSSWPKPKPRRRRSREAAHARELDINRRQQQIALDRSRRRCSTPEPASSRPRSQTLEARREPEREALAARRQAAAATPKRSARSPPAAFEPRRRVRPGPAAPSRASSRTSKRARGEVYAVVNTVTALAAAQYAAAQRERAVETPQRFEDGVARAAPPNSSVRVGRQSAAAALRRARKSSRRRASPAPRARRSWRARASSTSGVRASALARAGAGRTPARLRSLEEIDAHRAGFADAARMVL